MSYFNHPLFDALVDTLPPRYSNELSSIIASGDVNRLVSMDVDRSQPVDFEEVFFREFFRKVSDAPLNINTSEVAKNSFIAVERENSVTNDKILAIKENFENLPFSPVSIYFRRVRRQIAIILRDFDISKLYPRLTSGATVSLKSYNTPFDRLNKPTCSLDCLTYLRQNGQVRYNYDEPDTSSPSIFGSRKDDFNITDFCKLETVPKTAKTDRVIAKEPVVNLAYQAGISDIIRSRLKDFGLDITIADQNHKRLARESSITGDLATVDLSAASDRITTALVEFLLPKDWFEALSAFRSTSILIDESISTLQMFSPAGNGFTFDLETLIFYSMSLCASTENNIDVYESAPPFVSTFGDDIIIPSVRYERLITFFDIVGFKVNTRKSFATGHFRESCGGDFYNGNNVRGYNAKALPRTPDDWIRIINAIRRVCYYVNNGSWRYQWCEDLWNRLCQHVAEPARLYGPKHYGDSCINTEDESLYAIKRRRWQGEYIKVRVIDGYEYTSVGSEISRNATSGFIAIRLVTLESLKGHGLRVNSESVAEYPYSLLKGISKIYFKNKLIPYTLYGQAPSDIDELFSTIVCRSSHQLMDSRQVVARGLIREREAALRKQTALVSLLSTLQMHVKMRSDVQIKAKSALADIVF